MRRALLALLVFAIACQRETPAPPPVAPTTTTAATATTASTPPVTAATPTYKHAAEWYGRTRGFHFTMKGSGFDIEGDMERTTPGAERVRFKHAGAEWMGAAERTGVVWYRRTGGKWTKAAPPPFADGVYQRATIWIDPQKREGDAQPNGATGYRFTDANSGDVYSIAVDGQGRIEKLDVTGTRPLAMTITRRDETVNVDSAGK